MRHVSFSRFGKPSEVLGVSEGPLPEPGPGQIRIRTTLSAIHNHDLLTVSGDYGYKPELPATGGTEAAGIVDRLGEGVTGLTIGQRVAASGKGTWAGYYLAQAASVMPLPDSISDEAGSQLVSMPLSALALLDFVGVERGGWMIQNAANGAVGKALAMFAKSRGVNVINLVRRDQAVTELADLGIENVVSTAQQDWRETVKAISGAAPITAAVDGVGGTSSGDLLSVLGENGLLVSFGLMSGAPMQISAGDMIFKQAVVKGFWLAKIAPTMSAENRSALMTELVQSVARGDVKLQVSKIFQLEDIAKAADAAAEAGRTGKVLLRA